jgi:hypothetical protein
VKVPGEVFDGANVTIDGGLSVVVTLQFFEHDLAKMGHRETLLSLPAALDQLTQTARLRHAQASAVPRLCSSRVLGSLLPSNAEPAHGFCKPVERSRKTANALAYVGAPGLLAWPAHDFGSNQTLPVSGLACLLLDSALLLKCPCRLTKEFCRQRATVKLHSVARRDVHSVHCPGAASSGIKLNCS